MIDRRLAVLAEVDWRWLMVLVLLTVVVAAVAVGVVMCGGLW